MKKIVSILFIILVNFSTNLFADDSQSIKRIFEGKKSAKITIIAYESLTCGHCADFHKNVYPDLKKNFIDRGLVKIEFRHFPLAHFFWPEYKIFIMLELPSLLH